MNPADLVKLITLLLPLAEQGVAAAIELINHLRAQKSPSDDDLIAQTTQIDADTGSRLSAFLATLPAPAQS